MEIWIYALTSVVTVSIVSLAGAALLVMSHAKMDKTIPLLLSLAAGAMLGNAFLHLLPESLEHVHEHGGLLMTALVLGGLLAFFGLDLVLHWMGHCCSHKEEVQPVGKLVLFGDGLENFMDGIIIGAAYLVSVPAGIATTAAVIAHELPIELGDFGVLVHSGYKRMKALLLNLLSGLLSVAGCLLVLFLGSVAKEIVPFIAPVAAGGFTYLAVSSLLPQIKQNSAGSFRHYLCVLGGAGLMAVLLLLH